MPYLLSLALWELPYLGTGHACDHGKGRYGPVYPAIDEIAQMALLWRSRESLPYRSRAVWIRIAGPSHTEPLARTSSFLNSPTHSTRLAIARQVPH